MAENGARQRFAAEVAVKAGAIRRCFATEAVGRLGEPSAEPRTRDEHC